MSKVRVYSASSMNQIQEFIDDNKGIIYDSIKIGCYEIESSNSGVIFTIICKIRIE